MFSFKIYSYTTFCGLIASLQAPLSVVLLSVISMKLGIYATLKMNQFTSGDLNEGIAILQPKADIPLLAVTFSCNQSNGFDCRPFMLLSRVDSLKFTEWVLLSKYGIGKFFSAPASHRKYKCLFSLMQYACTIYMYMYHVICTICVFNTLNHINLW